MTVEELILKLTRLDVPNAKVAVSIEGDIQYATSVDVEEDEEDDSQTQLTILSTPMKDSIL